MKIIFDLDGTLADATHRQHFITSQLRENNDAWRQFYLACIDDPGIAPMIAVFKALHQDVVGHRIEIWTGRSELVRAETEFWCACELGAAVTLRMRPEADVFTPDVLLKHKWLVALPEAEWPQLVFEDRDQSVRMFRDHGIQCVHVAESRY